MSLTEQVNELVQILPLELNENGVRILERIVTIAAILYPQERAPVLRSLPSWAKHHNLTLPLFPAADQLAVLIHNLQCTNGSDSERDSVLERIADLLNGFSEQIVDRYLAKHAPSWALEHPAIAHLGGPAVQFALLESKLLELGAPERAGALLTELAWFRHRAPKVWRENESRIPAWVREHLMLQHANSLQQAEHVFAHDFLNAESAYSEDYMPHLTHEEYLEARAGFVSRWVGATLGQPTDDEQAAAIAAVNGHVQVIARAGSGKTRTLVNRALFLLNHCGVAHEELLLLAFNRDAAKEMSQRLTKHLGNRIPHVMTFHALAYAIVQPEESILIDEPEGSQQQSRVLQSVIDDHLRDRQFRGRIRTLMLANWRDDWGKIASGGHNKSPEDMLRYRRSLPNETLDGKYVKSYGEKVIANFLFEHDVPYRYERNHWWDGTNYRPDFTIETRDAKVVIEYFGLQGHPDYDAMSEAKTVFWRHKARDGWRFLEFSPKDVAQPDAICAQLRASLAKCRVACRQLSEDEIWQRVKDRAIDRYTKAVVGFVRRSRNLSLSADELDKIIACHQPTDNIETLFLQMAQQFYRSYLDRVSATGEDDFSGLMQNASRFVADGHTVFRRRLGGGDLRGLKFVFIDEYQDFSDLFFRLVSAFRQQNSEAGFFCVGDDWQAINGFAGSDLRFYRSFAEQFKPSRQLYLSTNYRSASQIVDIGNQLMHDRGKAASAANSDAGRVEIADLSTFQPDLHEEEAFPGDAFTPAVLRIVSKITEVGDDVTLLSRRNSLPWYVSLKQRGNQKLLEAFRDSLVPHLTNSEVQGKLIKISTAHKYKGLESSAVIICDAVRGCYPLIHPDSRFSRVFGDTLETLIDEERRLFYVALSRAVRRLIIVTENGNESPFLMEIQARIPLQALDWKDYPTPKHHRGERFTVKVGNMAGRGNATWILKDMLKADGYRWTSVGWPCWRKTVFTEGFGVGKLMESAAWSRTGDGIEVRISNETDQDLAVFEIHRGDWRLRFDQLGASGDIGGAAPRESAI